MNICQSIMMNCNLSRTDISGAGKFTPIVDKNANVKVENEIIDAVIPKSFPGKSFILNT